jgi:hypothetical protein
MKKLHQDFFKINREILKEIFTDKKQQALEAVINLPNEAQVLRSEAIIEARLYGKILTEINQLCEKRIKKLKECI